MTKTTIACVVAVAGLVACMHTDNLTVGDVSDAYIAPAVCAKEQQCRAAAFALAYPGGVSDCATKAAQALGSDRRSQVSGCTNADGQKCRDDYAALPCTTGDALEPSPPSCTKCG